MISIKEFDPKSLKIDKTWYKNIDIYSIGNINVKDSHYVKINCENSMYLIISEVGGYIKEKIEVNI